jgi:nitrate reductase gamma subunit
LRFPPDSVAGHPFLVEVFCVKKGKRGLGFIPVKWLLFLCVSAHFNLLPAFDAGAAWFIDQKKFHASVHGTFSCQDCHEDVSGRDLHPNPEDVVKKRSDFFAVDQCLVCHDHVLDTLEKGIHGSMTIRTPDSYQECYHCHEPHYQKPVGEETGLFDPGLPRHEQCGVCHKDEAALPPLSREDEACMVCHRTIQPGEEDRLRSICFHCHALEGTEAQQMTGKKVGLIGVEDYDSTPHANIACTNCHPQSVRFSHGQQVPSECTHCHHRHDEKVAHELHGLVTCGACHLGGVEPVREERTGRIVWDRTYEPGAPSQIHDIIADYDKKGCRNCHTKENRVGAAALILPPKSILCMPCHAATFSAGDAITIPALLVFSAGMVLMLGYVFTGTRGRKAERSSKERDSEGRAGRVARAVLLDVLLQRRLYLQSRKRWLIHGLIFYPFALRFSWGIAALLGSLWNPSGSWAWSMLDKNNALTGFLFDLTGAMIILGVFMALIRGGERAFDESPDVPRQDRFALTLIGAIAVAGFVLQGMRIAMTGYPPGSAWSFVGYPLSLFWAGATLTGVYGYVWHLHAVLTGVFIAYLPFSRLLHIIISPLVLIGNAVSRDEKGQRDRGA